MAPRHRSRRHRNPNRRRAHSQKRKGHQTPRRLGPRKIPRKSLGVERQTRRHHHQTAQKTRLRLRLGARSLHNGRPRRAQLKSARELFGMCPKSFRRTSQKGPNLSRRKNGQLVPCFAHRPLRRRGRNERSRRTHLALALSAARQEQQGNFGQAFGGRYNAPRNNAWRRSDRGQSKGRTLQRSRWNTSSTPASKQTDPRRRRRRS